MKSRTRAPEGFRLIPLEFGPEPGITRLFSVARQQADTSSPTDETRSPFVILRLHPDAVVYLGALGDPLGNSVYEWLEIHIQSADLALKSAPSSNQSTNLDLDRRWRNYYESWMEGSSDALYSRHSIEHPPALWFDAALEKPLSLEPEWRLCQDDEKLRSHGLPDYSDSCHRYLFRPGSEDSPLVPLTPSAPENEHTIPVKTAFSEAVPFNPEGGLILILKRPALALLEANKLVAGKSLSLRDDTAMFLDVHGATPESGSDFLATSPELFLYPGTGEPLRLAEALHLNLCWLLGGLRALQTATHATQRPLLNVAPDSFALHVPATGELPSFWSSHVALVRPGLLVCDTAPGLFLPNQPPPPSIFAHPNVRVALPGSGTVIIRQAQQEPGGAMEIEGTLVTPTEVRPQPDECLLVTLPIASETLEMRCSLLTSVKLGPGELRFRTQLHQVPRLARAALESANALPPLPAGYVLYPALSSPCDLYSMGIIAARLLLCGRDPSSLTMVDDELLALARGANEAHARDPSSSLGKIVGGLIRDASSGRWRNLLAPSNLVDTDASDEESAWQIVGSDLWNDILALILKMLTGSGPYCYAQTTAAAPATALHAVYEAPLADLMALRSRSRLLVLPGQASNRDIRQAILQMVEESSAPTRG